MNGSADPGHPTAVGVLEEWRGLLLRYDDDAQPYPRLRADAEAAVARWEWAAAGSELHRIEPFVRERETLPEPKLLREAPRPPANVELYGYDQHERIVLVREFDDSGDVVEEEFLRHAPGEITSIGFFISRHEPRLGLICRWRLRDGQVRELTKAFGSGIEGEGREAWVSVARYLYSGERVEQVEEEEFSDLWSGRRTDALITPTYAPDGRLLELYVRNPLSQLGSVLYRALPEDLPDLASQRETLTRRLSEAIAEALIASHPPGPLYGIVLSYGSLLGSDWIPTVSPLFEARRRYLLEAVQPTGKLRQNTFPPESEFEYYVDRPVSDILWDPWTNPEPHEYLPEGVDPAPYDPRVIDDATSFEDPELQRACEQYSQTAALVDRDAGERAITALLRDLAADLTKLAWTGRLDVTEDFVVIACPYDPAPDELQATLKHSLPPERYAEFAARGWIPSDEET